MKNSWNRSLEFYLGIDGVNENRKDQALQVSKSVDLSSLQRIEVIETGASQNLSDGCFGLLFAHLCSLENSKMFSVDLDPEITRLSQEMYSRYLPEYSLEHATTDSVQFLKNYSGNPTIVHLDSWDLDIYNPESSMLHGFLEFLAIKDKMQSGSYVIVDDNFMRNTVIYWDIFIDGVKTETEEFNVHQEILGKGTMIYHYCKRIDSDWELVGDHYHAGPNLKLILRKK